MSERQEQQTKKRRWFNLHRSTSNSGRTASSYALELLESRVLLSVDLAVAAAVHVKPETVAVPPQAVVMTMPQAPVVATGQQGELLSTTATSNNGPVVTDFSRLFPNLPAFAADTPAIHQALLELGKAGGLLDAGDDLSDPKTLITDPMKSLNNPDNPTMNAGMTFLGQFLDHDLTFDQTSILGQPQDPTSTPNSRTPAFDLDSVYGGGPILSPQLYDQSPDGKGIKFVIQEIPGSAAQSRGDVVRYDVQRDAQGVAVIGDPRNDENLMISQLHLAFQRFHNAVVDDITTTTCPTDPAQIFAEAQHTVQQHYQWIIVHEFLPKTVGSELVNNELTHGPTFYDAYDTPSIPVEFSVAAYRFGHSQVRPSYRANFGPEPGQEFFGLIFNDQLGASQDHADLRGGNGRRVVSSTGRPFSILVTAMFARISRSTHISHRPCWLCQPSPLR